MNRNNDPNFEFSGILTGKDLMKLPYSSSLGKDKLDRGHLISMEEAQEHRNRRLQFIEGPSVPKDPEVLGGSMDLESKTS